MSSIHGDGPPANVTSFDDPSDNTAMVSGSTGYHGNTLMMHTQIDHIQTFNGGYAAMVTEVSSDTPISLYFIVTCVWPGFVAMAISDIQASDGNLDNPTKH